MKSIAVTLAAVLWAPALLAGDIRADGAYVPLAPPAVMSHAAYLILENTGDTQRSLTGISAEGYGMAHLHRSEQVDGVATMSMIHQLDIAAGQSVRMEPGGLHIMLMRPDGPAAPGDTVTLTLTFSDGEQLFVDAVIKARGAGS